MLLKMFKWLKFRTFETLPGAQKGGANADNLIVFPNTINVRQAPIASVDSPTAALMLEKFNGSGERNWLLS